MSDYDELDRLFDTNPLEVLRRCREAERRLAELEGNGKHRIKIDSNGWVLRHPLDCRESGNLFDCPFNSAAGLLDPDDVPADGEFDVDLDAQGRLVLR